MKPNLRLFFCINLLFLTAYAHAQRDSLRIRLVKDLCNLLNRQYVSAILAQKMCDTISWKLRNGKYDSSLNAHEFAFELTKDMRRVSNDLHISVSPPVFDDMAEEERFSRMSEKKEWRVRSKRLKRSKKILEAYENKTKDDMFQYGDIKILPGNVGYVEIKAFTTTSYRRKENKNRIRFEQVIEFLAGTDAIILDLRGNRGGYLAMAAYTYSFFAPRSDNYFLTSEQHARYDSQGVWKELVFAKEYNASAKNGYNRIKAGKVFILTSAYTFSAGESIAYKIRQYRPQAIIVGEKTKGGGNALSWTKLERLFSAEIPESRVFDKMNNDYELEGHGVIPDIAVPADSACAVAYRLAISNLPPTGDKCRFFHKEKKIRQSDQNRNADSYADYPGDYRKMQIHEEEGKLMLTYDQLPKQELMPLAKDRFRIAQDRLIIHFIRDKNEMVSAIEMVHSKGFKELFRKL